MSRSPSLPFTKGFSCTSTDSAFSWRGAWEPSKHRKLKVFYSSFIIIFIISTSVSSSSAHTSNSTVGIVPSTLFLSEHQRQSHRNPHCFLKLTSSIYHCAILTLTIPVAWPSLWTLCLSAGCHTAGAPHHLLGSPRQPMRQKLWPITYYFWPLSIMLNLFT